MNVCVIIVALFGLARMSLADLGNSSPSNGACLCVTTEALNIRTGGGTSNRVIKLAKKGECFKYTGQKTHANGYTWYRIEVNGQAGWAAGKYFNLGSQSQCQAGPPHGACMCVTASKLNIRNGAGTHNGVVTTLSNGNCLLYRGGKTSANGLIWYSLNYNGRTVWAAGKYLRLGSASQCSGGTSGDACSAHGGPFNQNCLDCICQIESDCQPLACKWDVNSLSCGYYQIKAIYYSECGSHGKSWKSCASDRSCSESCVKNYINRYYRYCTGNTAPICCEQAARMHNGGPRGCQYSATVGYWNKMKACLARKRQ